MRSVRSFSALADRTKPTVRAPAARSRPSWPCCSPDREPRKRIKNSNGIAENSQGEKGRSGVWGWQINAGGMIRLDFIERGTAKKLDQLTGINHTYLFGEYQLLRLANFGAEDAIGDGTWFVGLAIEF